MTSEVIHSAYSGRRLFVRMCKPWYLNWSGPFSALGFTVFKGTAHSQSKRRNISYLPDSPEDSIWWYSASLKRKKNRDDSCQDPAGSLNTEVSSCLLWSHVRIHESTPPPHAKVNTLLIIEETDLDIYLINVSPLYPFQLSLNFVYNPVE